MGPDIDILKKNSLLLPSPVWTLPALPLGVSRKSQHFPARASSIACTGEKDTAQASIFQHSLRTCTPRLRVPVLPYLGAIDSGPYWEVPCEGGTLGCPGSAISIHSPATAGSFSLSRQLLQLHSRDLGEQRPANCLSRAEGLVAVITGDLTHRQSQLTSLGLGLMS